MGPRRKACCSGCQIIITEIRTQLAYPFALWETQNIVSQGPCRKVEWKDPPGCGGRQFRPARCSHAPLRAACRQPGVSRVASPGGLPSLDQVAAGKTEATAFSLSLLPAAAPSSAGPGPVRERPPPRLLLTGPFLSCDRVNMRPAA